MHNCTQCVYETTTKYYLNKHMKNIHQTIIKKEKKEDNLECTICKNILSCKQSKNKHELICKNKEKKEEKKEKDVECKFCQKVLSSKQCKDRHELICKKKVNNDIIQTIVFNANPNEYTIFKTDEITVENIIKKFKLQIKNKQIDYKKISNKLFEIIWDIKENQCIKKKYITQNVSKISGENNTWLSLQDKYIYSKLISDLSYTCANMITLYNDKLKTIIKEKIVDDILDFFDGMAIVDLDEDEKKTDEDMKCESYALGYEKEEANDYKIATLKENDRLDVFNDEIKIFKSKAYNKK